MYGWHHIALKTHALLCWPVYKETCRFGFVFCCCFFFFSAWTIGKNAFKTFWKLLNNICDFNRELVSVDRQKDHEISVWRNTTCYRANSIDCIIINKRLMKFQTTTECARAQKNRVLIKKKPWQQNQNKRGILIRRVRKENIAKKRLCSYYFSCGCWEPKLNTPLTI